MNKFNVLIWDTNTDRLTTYDVLPYFRKEYKECRKKDKPVTREQWHQFVKSKGMYMFWSRCEYELIILPWPSKNKEVKIDVWQQIASNIDLIVDILMEENNDCSLD